MHMIGLLWCICIGFVLFNRGECTYKNLNCDYDFISITIQYQYGVTENFRYHIGFVNKINIFNDNNPLKTIKLSSAIAILFCFLGKKILLYLNYYLAVDIRYSVYVIKGKYTNYKQVK